MPAPLKLVFAAADLLRVKSCAGVSPGTTNLDPAWIANLLRPAYRQDFAFVAPLYSRGKFQGLLARNLLYPMSRAIFGVRIREMFSDEWGFSGRLAAQCATQKMNEAVRARPEAWMAVNAICNGMKCCQSYLGPKAPPATAGPDIVETIRQTVGNLFWCCDAFQDHWLDRTGTEGVQTFGSDHEVTQEDPPARQDKGFEFFRNGVRDLQDTVLKPILTPDALAKLKETAALDIDKFHFSSELWVRILYDFAAAYHRSTIARDHVLQALVPLYRGQLFSFLAEHAQSTPEEMEADTEALCLEFERQKPYLIERWKAKS